MTTLPTINAVPSAGSHDALGCEMQHLRRGEELQRPGLVIYRRSHDGHALSRISTPASRRGFLMGVSLSDGHHRHILQGALAGFHGFGRGAIYLRSFEEPYSADVHDPFDFALFEMSPGFFAQLADDRVDGSAVDLQPVAARQDRVLQHLVQALLPSLEKPRTASMHFVDQLCIAIGSHVIRGYGGIATAQPRLAMLSKSQVSRAKELLLAKARGINTIPDIARECNMSASYFLRAFKETTGQTPHQWAVSQRVAMACDYLKNSSLTLAEIAVACHFYDQSHFNRIFTQVVGVPPGVWRRESR